MIRYVLLAVAACAFAAPATAENTSTAKTMGLATSFTLCGDSGGQKTCSKDKWAYAVKPDGWELQVTSTLNGSTTAWGETCKAGAYEFHGAGVAWKGTCALSGDARQLCFHTDLATPTAYMTALTDQCFAITGKTCSLTMKGKSNMLSQDGVSIINTFDTYAENVTECHVIGTVN